MNTVSENKIPTETPTPTTEAQINSQKEIDKSPTDALSKSLELLEQRINKIHEAQGFLEDIGDRLYWALDFSQCKEATEPLNNIVDVLNSSQDKLQDSCENLESILEEFKDKQKNLSNSLNQELIQSLQYL